MPVVELPPQDFAYEVLTLGGEKIAAGHTLSPDLPDLVPGQYQVILHDGNKVISSDRIRLEAAQTTELRYSPTKGSFELVP